MNEYQALEQARLEAIRDRTGFDFRRLRARAAQIQIETANAAAAEIAAAAVQRRVDLLQCGLDPADFIPENSGL